MPNPNPSWINTSCTDIKTSVNVNNKEIPLMLCRWGYRLTLCQINKISIHWVVTSPHKLTTANKINYEVFLKYLWTHWSSILIHTSASGQQQTAHLRFSSLYFVHWIFWHSSCVQAHAGFLLNSRKLQDTAFVNNRYSITSLTVADLKCQQFIKLTRAFHN